MTVSSRSRDMHAPVGLRDPGSYSAELEALRGVAILLVFFFHADAILNRESMHLVKASVSLVSAFVHAGHTGVTLFFVLSGFLLSRPFLAEGAGGPSVHRSRFFVRRALRILPLYYAWVILGTAANATSLADLARASSYLFLLEPFAGLAPRLVPHSDVWWSLSTEAQFYLLLPLLGLSLRSSTGRYVGAAILVLYAAAYAAFATDRLGFQFDTGNQLLISLSSFGRGSAFLAGIGAAHVHGRYGARIREACTRQAWLRNGGADVVLLLVLLALGDQLRPVARVGFFFAENTMPAWHVPEALLWSAFVLAVLLLPLRTKRLLSNKPMQMIGLLSYSFYLCHMPLLFNTVLPLQIRYPERFDGWTAEAFAATAAALVVCIGSSALTYRFIERPFLTRKARVPD